MRPESPAGTREPRRIDRFACVLAHPPGLPVPCIASEALFHQAASAQPRARATIRPDPPTSSASFGTLEKRRAWTRSDTRPGPGEGWPRSGLCSRAPRRRSPALHQTLGNNRTPRSARSAVPEVLGFRGTTTSAGRAPVRSGWREGRGSQGAGRARRRAVIQRGGVLRSTVMSSIAFEIGAPPPSTIATRIRVGPGTHRLCERYCGAFVAARWAAQRNLDSNTEHRSGRRRSRARAAGARACGDPGLAA